MKLYNAKFNYIGAGLFQLQLSFETDKQNKADVVVSSLGATLRSGDTKETIAYKLREMATEIES